MYLGLGLGEKLTPEKMELVNLMLHLNKLERIEERQKELLSITTGEINNLKKIMEEMLMKICEQKYRLSLEVKNG